MAYFDSYAVQAIGADEAFDYAGAASARAQSAIAGSSSYALVVMGLHGANPRVTLYPTQRAGADAFEAAANANVSSNAYVGLFSKDSTEQERYFGVTDIVENTWLARAKSLAVPLMGAAALVAIAVFATSEPKATRGTRKRRRRLARWRRRTTTVWR